MFEVIRGVGSENDTKTTPAFWSLPDGLSRARLEGRINDLMCQFCDRSNQRYMETELPIIEHISQHYRPDSRIWSHIDTTVRLS